MSPRCPTRSESSVLSGSARFSAVRVLPANRTPRVSRRSTGWCLRDASVYLFCRPTGMAPASTGAYARSVPPDAGDEVVRVAELFADVARLLAEHHDLQSTLERMVKLAVERLEGCEFAGISLVEGRKITSPAASSDLPRTVDRIQSEVDEGPCLDAIREHEVFQTGNLAREDRWPRFSTRANQETGITSILSLRLFVDENTLGALNLYSTRPDSFDEVDVALALVFAAHAAVAMSSARREEQLERKADSRDLIGQAKGMLMARSGMDDAEAFDLLRRASQRLNLRLVEVATRSSTDAAATTRRGARRPDAPRWHRPPTTRAGGRPGAACAPRASHLRSERIAPCYGWLGAPA